VEGHGFSHAAAVWNHAALALRASLRLPAFRPVMMVAQEEVFIPEIKCCAAEEPADAHVPHALKAAIGGVHTAADDFEFTSLDLATEAIIFGEVDAFVETSKLAEFFHLKHHEHSSAEGTVQA
jgi:hypothetical protein